MDPKQSAKTAADIYKENIGSMRHAAVMSQRIYHENENVYVVDNDVVGIYKSTRPNDPLIIAFRGSDDKQDWLKNIGAVSLDPRKSILVHQGFNSPLDKIAKFQASPDNQTDMNQSLLEVIKKEIKTTNGEVIITGHSRGGGIAQSLTNRLIEDSKKDSGLAEKLKETLLITNAPAPAGLEVYSKVQKATETGNLKCCINVFDKNDIVPSIPGQSYFPGISFVWNSDVKKYEAASGDSVKSLLKAPVDLAKDANTLLTQQALKAHNAENIADNLRMASDDPRESLTNPDAEINRNEPTKDIEGALMGIPNIATLPRLPQTPKTTGRR